MPSISKVLPVLLYFYQGDISQDEVNKVVDAFPDMNVHLRKVHDINDTRDSLEKCAYAAGAVPLIYFVRTASGVLTGGIKDDPLGRPNAAKSNGAADPDEVDDKKTVTLATDQPQPTDAQLTARLLAEEVEQAQAKKTEPAIDVSDIKVDEKGSTASSVTGQIQPTTVEPTKAAAKKEATVAPAAVKAPTK